MTVTSSLVPLLSSFDMDVRTGSWLATLDDYIASEPEVGLLATADALDELVKAIPNEALLADELFSIGCFCAPDDSYHAWLLTVASCLRERADPSLTKRPYILRLPKRI